MKVSVAIAGVCLSMATAINTAEADEDAPSTHSEVATIDQSVRVELLRVGTTTSVQSVSGGSASSNGCAWTSVRASTQLDGGIAISGGPSTEGAVLYNLFCNGDYYSTVWVSPEDIVDVDAAVQAEAERYVQDVLAPAVRIGVNPHGRGLVGLASWFWIEGFTGSVQAPPISAFGMTVDVRMSSGTVTWDFDDGTVEPGDLGKAYPEESSVQHIHQRHGTYEVTAQIELVPEYSVNGGPWLTLPNLSVTAATSHPVEQRQPVLTNR